MPANPATLAHTRQAPARRCPLCGVRLGREKRCLDCHAPTGRYCGDCGKPVEKAAFRPGVGAASPCCGAEIFCDRALKVPDDGEALDGIRDEPAVAAWIEGLWRTEREHS